MGKGRGRYAISFHFSSYLIEVEEMENRKMYYRHAKIKLFQRVVIDVQRCLEKTRTFGVLRDLVRLTTRDHLFLI